MYVIGKKMANFTLFLQKKHQKNLAIFPQRIIPLLTSPEKLPTMHSCNDGEKLPLVLKKME